MKVALIVLLGVLVLPATSQAQGPLMIAQSESLKSQSINVFGDKIPSNAPGRSKMRAGSTMMITGAALVGVGVALVASAGGTVTYSNNNGEEEGNAGGAIGALSIVGGIGLFVPGVIIHSKGKKRYNEYLKTRTAVSFKVTGNSIGVSLKF